MCRAVHAALFVLQRPLTDSKSATLTVDMNKLANGDPRQSEQIMMLTTDSCKDGGRAETGYPKQTFCSNTDKQESDC